MKISRDDRKRLRELREQFLEHRRVGVYCAIATFQNATKKTTAAQITAVSFAEYFRNEMVPFISGSSVVSAPDPNDPEGNETLGISTNDTHAEMLFTDGTYKTLTWYSELASEAWTALPVELRSPKPILLDDGVPSHIRRKYVLWTQVVFNILEEVAGAVEFRRIATKTGIPPLAWLRENLFLASADAIGLILENAPKSPISAARKLEIAPTPMKIAVTAGEDDQLDKEESAIVCLLREVGQRLTTAQIFDEFSKRKQIKAESTIKLKLSQLTKRGVLNNRQDLKPRGYGLADWK